MFCGLCSLTSKSGLRRDMLAASRGWLSFGGWWHWVAGLVCFVWVVVVYSRTANSQGRSGSLDVVMDVWMSW